MNTTESIYELFNQSDIQAILDSVPDTLLIVEGHGNAILFASANAPLTTGYTPQELCAMTVEDLLPDGLRSRHVKLRSGFQKNPETRWMGQNRGALLLKMANGEIRKIEAQLNPLVLRGTDLILAWIRDITDRRVEMDFDEKKLVGALLTLYREATTPENRLDQIMNQD